MMRVVDVVVMMGGGVAVDPRDELTELYDVWLAGPALRREIADRAHRLGFGARCINRAFEELGGLTVVGSRGRGSAAVWAADKHQRLRGRQKPKTNVGSVIRQVHDFRELLECLGWGGVHPAKAAASAWSARLGLSTQRPRSHHHVHQCWLTNSVSLPCRSSSSRAGPRREIGLHRRTCDSRLAVSNSAALAGLVDMPRCSLASIASQFGGV